MAVPSRKSAAVIAAVSEPACGCPATTTPYARSTTISAAEGIRVGSRNGAAAAIVHAKPISTTSAILRRWARVTGHD
ncbi:hypothetical protein [Allokutzneria sp. NRRL B-24872]|uniref:hypothetical protein n=1 Tax=Allokutzneria sp. NRRL B-24872 TaxID=1137961 RepID=UPI00143DBFE2|nr:hypothetical protein [Allokutzneria sp. NRRL B-24872]